MEFPEEVLQGQRSFINWLLPPFASLYTAAAASHGNQSRANVSFWKPISLFQMAFPGSFTRLFLKPLRLPTHAALLS